MVAVTEQDDPSLHWYLTTVQKWKHGVCHKTLIW